jgi:hypothetical protein
LTYGFFFLNAETIYFNCLQFWLFKLKKIRESLSYLKKNVSSAQNLAENRQKKKKKTALTE